MSCSGMVHTDDDNDNDGEDDNDDVLISIASDIFSRADCLVLKILNVIYF